MASQSAAGSSRIESQDGSDVLVLEGRWLLAESALLAAGLASLKPALGQIRSIDGSRLSAIDTAASLALWSELQAAGADTAAVSLAGFEASHGRIVELVRGRLADTAPPAQRKALGPLARLGQHGSEMGAMLAAHVGFLGRVIAELGLAIRQPSRLRLREWASQLGQTGVNAIPVVALVTFLIGVVFAYLLGLQAEQYGANIFVVDGVALGMTREFSPLIVATIVAGRSGAAFTAQLGTMKLTEETDAIRTLGLSAEQVLVVPRVLALMMTLPLLVFIGDIAGMTGALVIAESMLDLTPHGFIERLHAALAPRHYLIGLGKAPFFALVIAVIGCRMGMDVERDTRSIGINTTSTVVQGIVAVIVLDAIFAIICQQLGW